jgi:O-succinylbenzoic acid--CoA ligase
MIDHMILNGQIVSIETLKNRQPKSEFEQGIFSFWNEWNTNTQEFLLQTSGSTGPPKKILAQRSQLETSAKMTLAALSLKKNTTALVCLDSKYIGGKMMLVRSWVGGLNIIAKDPSSNPFQDLNNEAAIDFVALVPYQLKTILNSPEKKWFNKIKHVIVGGAPLDSTTKKLLQPFTTQFYETFGMTETLSHIALKKINGSARSDYFKILPGIHIRQDERACLCITAPHLPHEVITNDVVEMKNLEEFIWLGRVDNVINSGGIKIFPEATEQKIERVFSDMGLNNRYLIAGLPDEKWGQTVALIIEGNLTTAELSKLEEQLKINLSKFEIPRCINFVEKFEVTANGKINRGATLQYLQSYRSKDNKS